MTTEPVAPVGDPEPAARFWPVVHIPADVAIEALRRAAFTTAEGRTLVHSFAGGGGLMIGADLDLDSAIAYVGNASEIAWTTHILSHDLAVVAGGRLYHYDVPRPERAS